MRGLYQRALDENMFRDFQKGGPLHDLLTYVQNDDTLDLEFRGEYAANILLSRRQPLPHRPRRDGLYAHVRYEV